MKPNLGDLVCHRRYGTRRDKGIGIIVDIRPQKGNDEIVSVYWFKEGKEQQVWKQILQYVRR